MGDAWHTPQFRFVSAVRRWASLARAVRDQNRQRKENFMNRASGDECAASAERAPRARTERKRKIDSASRPLLGNFLRSLVELSPPTAALSTAIDGTQLIHPRAAFRLDP